MSAQTLRHRFFCLALIMLCGVPMTTSQPLPGRSPAVPLIVHDPYFSIWSFADTLTSDWPRHWTGANNGMCAMVRVDGTPYRLLGPGPSGVVPLTQRACAITPTRTTYEFAGGGLALRLSFLTPLLAQNVRWLARPVAYIECEVSSVDGKPHAVAFYFDIAAEVAVDNPAQQVVWGRYNGDSTEILRVGSLEQKILGRSGDDLRIDWGYLYLAARRAAGSALAAGGHETVRRAFAGTGTLPPRDDMNTPRPARDNWPVLAHARDFGRVLASARAHQFVLAYDDLYSIQYFQRNLRPYWRRDGEGAEDLLAIAFKEYASVTRECEEFDRQLTRDAEQLGGPGYAHLVALSYRQSLGANKIAADLDGTMLMFPKENYSNGCIGTVDVIYPASPLFLLLNPALLRAQLVPVLEYARLPRWKFAFAPHDLGTYPLANGQVYGGGEETEKNQMPVEESGNMLLMVAGVAAAEGNAEFAGQYWPLLTRWADYLRQKGLDPENQLCTDDFAGHLAHNVNLSAKAILALGAYAKMAAMLGKTDDAAAYRTLAERFAREWQSMADDGDHYRLAFDRPGTWSQKYNLVWDRLLELNLFPPEVTRKEIRFYLAKQNPYGLPLDSRKDYTKLDWILWTAAMAETREDGARFIEPVARFVRETADRVPLTDWYWTSSARQVGFQARSVVGGVMMPMLTDRATALSWQERFRGKNP